MKNPPYVSVVVPVFNAEATIRKLIESLLRQTYPPDSYEVIVVNNGSIDSTESIVRKFPVALIDENRVKSSYAARNTGVANAKGQIIAFTDADCIAAENWLQNGVNKMRAENADLVGGKINFIFSSAMTATDVYDAINHLDSRANVKNMKAAATANLFVKASVFRSMGPFPEVRSGGDMQFTHNAVLKGYSLVFADEAQVFHPTRDFKHMLKKSFRIGTGTIDVLKMQNAEKSKIFLEIFRCLFPQSVTSICRRIREREVKGAEKQIYRVFFISYLFRLARLLGILSNIGRLFQKARPMTRRDFIASNIPG